MSEVWISLVPPLSMDLFRTHHDRSEDSEDGENNGDDGDDGDVPLHTAVSNVHTITGGHS